MKKLYADARRIYKNRGAKGLIKAAYGFSTRYIRSGFRNPDYQAELRQDLDKRVQIIENNISKSDKNLLDIGCADGALTEKIAENDIFCLGLEVSKVRLNKARNKTPKDNLGFVEYEANPDNLINVPNFDIVLLLTVYQHWGRQYGWESAEDMLRLLGTKTNKLFFEAHDSTLKKESISESMSIFSYYENYINDVFNGKVTVDHIGNAEYKGGSRIDPIFMIDCSNYKG